MGFNESFEAAKNFAVSAAQTAAQKAKVLAAIAKTNVSIYAEEDKIKKAEAQLGKLYYRDYAVGEEQDSAEYLPWCQKIDESKQVIAKLQDEIAQLRAQEEAEAAAEETCACTCGTSDEETKCCCAGSEEEKSEEAPCACEQPEASADSVEIKIETTDAPEA